MHAKLPGSITRSTTRNEPTTTRNTVSTPGKQPSAVSQPLAGHDFSRVRITQLTVQRQVNEPPGNRLPSNFPFLPKPALLRPKRSTSAKSPSLVSGDFVVRDSQNRWFYGHYACTADTSTTAIDNTRVGPYATPAQPNENYHCTCNLTPLSEYVAHLKAVQQEGLEASRKAFENRPKATGALTPVYVEFDAILLARASGVSRLFDAAGILVELGTGGYTGGNIPGYLFDRVLGELAKPLAGIIWKEVHHVPIEFAAGEKLEWLEEVTKYSLKEVLPSLPK